MSGPIVAIRSVPWASYLRLEAEGLTKQKPTGSGSLTTQPAIGSEEKYILERNSDGTVSFQSLAYPNCYIRTDGSAGSVDPNTTGNAHGYYNAQFGKFSHERFNIVYQGEGATGVESGKVGLESAQYPGRYMRVAPTGEVNVQGVCGVHEVFEIVVIGYKD